MKKLLYILLIPVILSCDSGDATIVIDLYESLEPTEINYQSPVFTVSEDIPVGENIPATENLTFSSMTLTNEINPIRNLDNVESIKLVYEADLEAQEFSGSATLRLYVGLSPDLLNNESTIVLSDTELLPNTFLLESDNPNLEFLFDQDEVFIMFEYIIEPRLVNQRQIALGATTQLFRLEIVGGQSLR